MANEFGAYLKKLREDRELTLREVEAKAKISNAYLSQLERGEKGIPTIKVLSRLAKAYGVLINEMMAKAESAFKDEKIDITATTPNGEFVARGYDKLPEDKKMALQSYLQHLLSEAKKQK
ncbi:MAG: helix-turn-helix transcriptional regulator [bacterium]|nr:helix-turn-helix transcriptional regulator [bacterium]MDD5757091.1 helix-turn-helix transcriptional regulator [bacterium]